MKSLDKLKDRMKREIRDNLASFVTPESIPYIAHILLQELFQVFYYYSIAPLHSHHQQQTPSLLYLHHMIEKGFSPNQVFSGEK